MEEIKLARDIFKKHFERDEDFRRGYKDNIAVILYDKYGLDDYNLRNQIADDIMKVIFDAEEIKIKRKNNKSSVNRFEILDL